VFPAREPEAPRLNVAEDKGPGLSGRLSGAPGRHPAAEQSTGSPGPLSGAEMQNAAPKRPEPPLTPAGINHQEEVCHDCPRNLRSNRGSDYGKRIARDLELAVGGRNGASADKGGC